MNETSPSSNSLVSFVFTLTSFLAFFIASPIVLDHKLTFYGIQFVTISIVIWQACDPFADAAQWMGKKLRLPGSVRGATLDAIASSMPELYTGIFFVVIAVSGSEASGGHTEGDGFGASLATCAGSAIYNMILIPAFCVLTISFARKSRPTIDVEPEVISRDGMWFLGTEAVLIAFMFQDHMHWWMGLVFLLLYAVYVLQLIRDARIYRRAMKLLEEKFGKLDRQLDRQRIASMLDEAGISSNPVLIDQLKRNRQSEEEGLEATAGIIFQCIAIPLNWLSAILIILTSTFVAGISCYFLVEAAQETATHLNVPVFFIAVILVAAASSVPDTFLSIGAARRGDDSGAVSNAFGSNIFDICVSLSIPLLVNSYLLGWKPVPLTSNGEPMAGLVDLRILLAILTGVTLLIMWHNRQLTRTKGLILCGLYGIFLAYAVAGSLGFTLFR
ncbi:MAG: hypothetical protein AAGA30_11480 [Planctomycetota bacterium]